VPGRRSLLGPAHHGRGALQVVPQALGPPGRPGLLERSRQVRRGGRVGRAHSGHDEVKRFGIPSGFGPRIRQEPVNLADGRGVRLPRPPVLSVRHQRDGAVPARRAAHRASGRPHTADPHRHPRALHRGRQEHHVVDDHVVAVEGHRLARPQQVEGRQALVQARRDVPRIGGLAEGAELVRQRSAQAHPQDHPAAGEPVQGRHLPGQLRHPPPRDRRDHRAQPDRLCRERGGGQQYPRIGDVPQPRFRVGDVVPDEQAVPARVLGAPGQVGDDAGVGEVAEVRHVDGEVHGLATRGGQR
jgi:hypothetical protein